MKHNIKCKRCRKRTFHKCQTLSNYLSPYSFSVTIVPLTLLKAIYNDCKMHITRSKSTEKKMRLMSEELNKHSKDIKKLYVESALDYILHGYRIIKTSFHHEEIHPTCRIREGSHGSTDILHRAAPAHPHTK